MRFNFRFHGWVNSYRASEYVAKYASKDAADEAGEGDASDEEMSSVGSFESGDEEEPAGNMEEL